MGRTRWYDSFVAREGESVGSPVAPPSSVSEAEVIDGAAFSDVMLAWKSEWEADRPVYSSTGAAARGGLFGYEPEGEQILTLSAVAYLSEKTGIGRDRIYRLISGKVEQVPLSQGDAILAAAGLQHKLSPVSGCLEIVPDKTWSQERWLAYMRERGCA